MTICNRQAPVRHTVMAILRPAYPPSPKMRSMNGELASRPPQQLESTITVLNVSGMNDDVQQEAQRVDQDVPLATLDLLARVVA